MNPKRASGTRRICSRSSCTHFKSKKVHKLPVVKYYLDKVENKSYQGVEFSGFANAKER